ncbi:cold shock domain-containing protein [Candidatus Nanohalovita haloferacivicina]|uniref:cold shock domain-containing protein n=1 Tax=Candidatus Nanohalovita haloferacivicina TaxID=2978046 RepID=UPI00325FC3B9|nr:Cold shock protein [Candidatus Nanohalobia archaeon BNXNv]
MKGTVKFFHDQKKYGFIEAEDMDDDLFFHVSDLEGDSIEEDTDVEFEQEEGDRGPKAVNVVEAGAEETDEEIEA